MHVHKGPPPHLHLQEGKRGTEMEKINPKSPVCSTQTCLIVTAIQISEKQGRLTLKTHFHRTTMPSVMLTLLTEVTRGERVPLHFHRITAPVNKPPRPGHSPSHGGGITPSNTPAPQEKIRTRWHCKTNTRGSQAPKKNKIQCFI